MTNALLWIRNDARLDDNPALHNAFDAVSGDGQLTVLFVLDPRLTGPVSHRRFSLLLDGLRDLDRSLSEHGGRLLVHRGDPVAVVPSVASRIAVAEVHVNRSVTPFGRKRDAAVNEVIDLVTADGTTAAAPDAVRTGSGTPYRVFTPFWRSWTDHVPPPMSPPALTGRVASVPGDPLPPNPVTTPLAGGEHPARTRLDAFVREVDDYPEVRDKIDDGTGSGLSVDLKYGWIGPRRVMAAVGTGSDGRTAYRRQIAWRDFFAQVMLAWPETVDAPFHAKYRTIAWADEPADIEAWKTGRTGYPIVDASMRQLVATGRLHNRLRMVAASFLTKDLLVDWRIGERFFRHHLLDGDTPQNVGNWQWVAGTGADAAPYFRVFNPTSQSKRWDPDGVFLRRWLPELAALKAPAIHDPASCAAEELAAAGIVLGEHYPVPIIDHGWARDRVLAAFGRV